MDFTSAVRDETTSHGAANRARAGGRGTGRGSGQPPETPGAVAGDGLEKKIEKG